MPKISEDFSLYSLSFTRFFERPQRLVSRSIYLLSTVEDFFPFTLFFIIIFDMPRSIFAYINLYL